MPVPSHADFMAMTWEDVISLKSSPNTQTALRATQHDTYRHDLVTYSNDILEKADLGIGSNPPGSPPQPPGT